MTLNCPQPYSVDGITYPRHVHYCLLKKDNLWSDDIKTIIVTCDVDFKTMKQFVKDKCHLIINVLSKESYERCKIPGSINIPLLSFQKDDAIDAIRNSLKDFDKLKKFRGKRLFELPIVVYCKNIECKASEKMIELLIDTGFRNLLEYSDGIIGWMRQSKSKCDDKVGGSPKSKKSEESDEPDEQKKKSDESDESDDTKKKSDESDESDDTKEKIR